jgi:hypothetical protein
MHDTITKWEYLRESRLMRITQIRTDDKGNKETHYVLLDSFTLDKLRG